MNEPLSPSTFVTQQMQSLRENWGWLVALGVGLILLGVIAIVYAAVTSLVVGVFLAILIILAGIAHLAHVLSARKWSGFFLQLILGGLLLLAGIMLFFRPMIMASALALIIGIALLFHGIGQIVLAWQHRGVPNWFLFLISGVVTTLLGLFIMLGWPFSFVVIGIFVGIQLIFEGLAFLMLGMAAKSLPREVEGDSAEEPMSGEIT